MNKWIWHCCLWSCCGIACGEEPQSPLAPADEFQTFQLADERLTIELVAAEPDVVDPVACAWDERGNLYVVEMRDYPEGPAPAGQIKLLTDADGDGRYSQASVFASELNYPTSVLPYRDGVFVTAAPNLWYLKDTDGDGQADERRVIFTGFGEGNQQLRVNGLTWGRDGWIYGSNGRSDGDVRQPEQPPESAVSLRRHDFRFHPETLAFEPMAGTSQYGVAINDAGDHFLSWNTVPMRHMVIADAWLARHGGLAGAAALNILIDASKTGRVYPLALPRTFNRESIQHFNASCGLAIYRGDALPTEYVGNALVCEALLGLVHRRVLVPDGATYRGERGPQEVERELLAASDPWFRPVNLTTGPDGALYVVDFYRKWVEHPQFVPEASRGGVDYRTGDDRGRIWRIRQKDRHAAAAAPWPDQCDTAALVDRLDHACGWQRDTAQRLLLTRGDSPTADLVRRGLDATRSVQGRRLALATLNALDELPPELLLKSLKHPEAEIRELALTLIPEQRRCEPQFVASVLKLATDESPRVRLQAALALGELKLPAALNAMAALATAHPDDNWLRLALLSGLAERELEFVRQVVVQAPQWLAAPNAAQQAALRDVGELLGRRGDQAELTSALALDGEGKLSPGQLALTTGIGAGLETTGKRLDTAFAADSQAAQRLAALLEQAAHIASDSSQSAEHRELAIELLSSAEPLKTLDVMSLLDANQPDEVQLAAARAMGRWADFELARSAMELWGRLSTKTRRRFASSLLRTQPMVAVLLDGLEAGTVADGELDAAQREALWRIDDAALRARVGKLIGEPGKSDRSAVVNDFQAALQLPGSSPRGAQLFQQHCNTCHAMAGQGGHIGPDLASVKSRAATSLLVDVLDPSREVPPDYMNYLIETADGQLLGGLLVAEAANAITLRGVDGAQATIARERIERFQSTGKSLMPEGFEQKLAPQDIADVLAFLTQTESKAPPKPRP